MTQANNAGPTTPRLRIGLMAEPGALSQLVPALTACDRLEIVAQSGMLAGSAAPHWPHVPDLRVLLEDPQIQAVVVALPTRRGTEVIRQALTRPLHVWALPPLAAAFDEAVELIALTRKQRAILRIASWWEIVVEQAWHDLAWPEGFQVTFSDGSVSASGPDPSYWQADPKAAAGGVLAAAGYRLLESLAISRGLPETVVAATLRQPPDAAGVQRQTEDAAVAILRYGNDAIGTVRAAWDLAPHELRLCHQSATATVVLGEDELTLLGNDGTARDRHPLAGDFLLGEFQRFVALVEGQAHGQAVATLERHLLVSALLESIYLAARTNHPESPRKLYELHGLPVPRA